MPRIEEDISRKAASRPQTHHCKESRGFTKIRHTGKFIVNLSLAVTILPLGTLERYVGNLHAWIIKMKS